MHAVKGELILKSLAGDEYGGTVLYNYDEFERSMNLKQLKPTKRRKAVFSTGSATVCS